VSLEKVSIGRKREGKSFLGHWVLMLALCCLFNSRALRERERARERERERESERECVKWKDPEAWN